MGKLSASILAADLARLGDEIRAVEPFAEVIHVDVMDGHFVPPIALGAVVVASLRPVTTRTLHGHLMVDSPAALFDDLREAGLDVVSFHLEAVPEPGPVIDKARGAGLGVGLTLNLETPVDAVVPYLERIDDVMLMSIRPGWSYQQLDPDVYPRVEAVRDHVDRLGLAVDLEVDGGIKVGNARRAVDAGANVLIAASGIFGQPDPAAAAAELQAIVAGAG
ncbi:MAG TPA: ribulose-phosphate 3-epimerase [Actinomycetota bacterium]|nr:ribulose-phosphate 3-epimerase [Actinomycetota bacterium]